VYVWRIFIEVLCDLAGAAQITGDSERTVRPGASDPGATHGNVLKVHLLAFIFQRLFRLNRLAKTEICD
jgi:hypothetical protein